MRRDALRNRERLLVAAGQAFEEKGLDARVADVARAAGVGMGTLHRRFASKDALIEALVSEVLETTRTNAPDALRRHLDLLVAGMRPANAALAHRSLSQNQVDRILSKRALSSSARAGGSLP